MLKSIEASASGRSDDSDCHHEHGTDDGRAGPIDFHPRELAQGEDEVAAEENQVSGERARIGEQRRTERDHRLYTLTALRMAHA